MHLKNLTMGKVSKMESIPESMHVPQMRRDISKGQNVTWLLRNLGVNNRTHPEFEETICMLKKERKPQLFVLPRR